MKQGAEGATVVADGDVHRAEAEPIEEVDPTGAGDAFDGVLLAALARGLSMDDALAARATPEPSRPAPPGAGPWRQGRREPFVIADEVRDALEAGRGVVGLETSVIGQGLPHPRNLECIERMSAGRSLGRRGAGMDRRYRRLGHRRILRRPTGTIRRPGAADKGHGHHHRLVGRLRRRSGRSGYDPTRASRSDDWRKSLQHCPLPARTPAIGLMRMRKPRHEFA